MSQSLHPSGLFPPGALRIRPGRRSPASMWQAAWQMLVRATSDLSWLPQRDLRMALPLLDSSCRDPSGDGCSNASSTCAKKNVAAALAAAFFNSINSVQGTTRWTNSFMFGSWGTSTAATAWETLGGPLNLKSNLQWLAWLKRHPSPVTGFVPPHLVWFVRFLSLKVPPS